MLGGGCSALFSSANGFLQFHIPLNSCKNKAVKSICCVTPRFHVIKAKIVKHEKADLKAQIGSCLSAYRLLPQDARLNSRLCCYESRLTQAKSGTSVLFLCVWCGLFLFVLGFLDPNFHSSPKLPLHAAV